MLTNSVMLWGGFSLFVLTMLVLDLGIFHRRAHTTTMREAAIWTVVWVLMALAFCALIYWYRGKGPTIEFLTGYVIEWSLSMDNVFVFSVIFSYFTVPQQFQHRVLFWGILGAIAMRLTFILAGAVLLDRFHWLVYPMGAFLVLTGLKLFFKQRSDSDLSKNWVVRTARRWLPFTANYVDQNFFVRADSLLGAEDKAESVLNGVESGERPLRSFRGWLATPLLLVLLVVETTDVAFAVDSIPAIFAVTHDPFIVFTSNVFAILGLRALYFLLAGAMQMFRYLNVGLAAILCFVGIKMLISKWMELSILVSLGLVAGILIVSILFSILTTRIASRRRGARHDVENDYESLHESCGVVQEGRRESR